MSPSSCQRAIAAWRESSACWICPVRPASHECASSSAARSAGGKLARIARARAGTARPPPDARRRQARALRRPARSGAPPAPSSAASAWCASRGSNDVLASGCASSAASTRCFERPSPLRIDALEHGLPSQLVAERQPVRRAHEHPPLDALGDRIGVRREHGFEQPALDRPGHDRRDVENVAGGRRQSDRPRQDRVTHGCGNAVAAGGEDLGDEERVAARARVQTACRPLRALRQLGDGLLASAGRAARGASIDSAGRRARAAADAAARSRRRDTSGRGGSDPVDAAPQVLERVQRRLVGPVDVLEHHQRRLGDELVEEGCEERQGGRRRLPAARRERRPRRGRCRTRDRAGEA